MSENPFKIIKSTEQPPESLKKEVMGSVKSLELVLRLMQLFIADYSSAMINKFKTDVGTENEITK